MYCRRWPGCHRRLRRAWLCSGPQGSRKTTLRPVVAEQLGLGDDVVYFDGDDHNDFHPHYDRLARQHGAPEAARLIREDNEIIRGAILSEVRTRRLSIMFVGPYTHSEYTLGRLAEFRADGYRTDVAYTALHPALSQLAAMDRHLAALTDGPGYSFLVSPELLERVISNVPAVVTRIEAEKAADALHVVDAGGIAFSKRLGDDSVWAPDRPTADAVEEIRLRPWGQSVTADFLRRRERVEAAPIGEDPQLWAARLARVDELAAPMITPHRETVAPLCPRQQGSARPPRRHVRAPRRRRARRRRSIHPRTGQRGRKADPDGLDSGRPWAVRSTSSSGSAGSSIAAKGETGGFVPHPGGFRRR
ncbi:zeta toxin family protein [Streptomyces sp. CA-251251]|uniref:zeta toxin family protein n=1 Tax=Streptomyces sp. CA-251251 TaxID=3240063 RepID=UPI003D8D7C42